jgi:response regulator RpfG family c-di-GMP phosphodiesterase
MNERFSILLVDDERDVRSALRRTLYVPGYTVYEANDGVEALEVLKEVEIHAVVSDYDMPRMDGMALLQRVRILRPDAVRVLITARADLNVAVRAINEGAVHRFLLKPWDRIDVRGIVQMALHQRPDPIVGTVQELS